MSHHQSNAETEVETEVTPHTSERSQSAPQDDTVTDSDQYSVSEMSQAKPQLQRASATNHHAFVCIFKDYKRIEALLLACVERGLPGGTLLDGRGMGQVLCQDIPLFIHLRERFPAADGDSYVFLSVVTDEQLDLCFDLTEHIGGPAAQGVAFSMPIGRFRRFSTSQDYFSVDAASGPPQV